MKGDEERCLAAGCNAYTSKPVDPDKLVALIAQHLRPPRGVGNPPGTPAPSEAEAPQSLADPSRDGYGAASARGEPLPDGRGSDGEEGRIRDSEWEKGTGTFCLKGPKGASPKTYLSPFPIHGRQKVPDSFSSHTRLYGELLAALEQAVADLEKALHVNDVTTMARVGEQLGRLSTEAGVAELNHLAQDIEDAASQGDIDALPALLGLLRDELGHHQETPRE
jgi:CheY-like chemotaxis protein